MSSLGSRAVIVKASPERGESLLGYLIRITELNGYPNPNWLLGDCEADLYKYSLLSLSEELAALAPTLGLQVPRLRPMVHRSSQYRNASTVLFGGLHEVPSSAMNSSAPKVCLRCLRENGFVKMIWDLRAYVVCPDHAAMLVDSCPKCGAKFRPTRGQLFPCPCSRVLDCDGAKVSDPSVIELMRVLENRFHCFEQYDYRTRFPAPFYALPLRGQLAVILLLGTKRLDPRSRRIDWPGRNLCEFREMISVAADALKHWPERFYRYLDVLFSDLREPIYRYNHHFYETLQTAVNRKHFEFIAEGLGAYACRKESEEQFVSLRGNPWLKGKYPKTQLTTMSDARAFLKISRTELQRLIRIGVLKTRTCSGEDGEPHQRVLSECMREYGRYRRTLLKKKLAAKQLGCTSKMLDVLVAEGFVPAVHGPGLDGAAYWLFDPDELDRILEVLDSWCRPPQARTTNLPIVAAVQKFNQCGASLPLVLRLVNSGRIKISMSELKGSRGLQRYLVCLEDVERLFKNDERGLGGTQFLNSGAVEGERDVVAVQEVSSSSATYTE